MRTIGMTEKPAEIEKESLIEVSQETTKAELISKAEESGITLTPAEKRLNKEKLAECIANKQNNESI